MNTRWLPLALLVGCSHPSSPRPAVDASPPTPAAPAAPADLLARATLSHPTATADALSRAVGTRIPVEMTLALALGVDVSVLSAIDPARPIDLALTGSLDTPRWTIALTPTTAARARAALAPRYRFVTVAGLGDRLEPREGGLNEGARRMPCALIAVPAEISARVVCAADEETLRAAGRWTAFESTHSREDGPDLRFVAEREAIRSRVVPAIAGRLRGSQRVLAAEASAARREHDRAPDLGDPEAAVSLLGDLVRELELAGDETGRAELSVALGEREVTLRANALLQGDGRSAVASDARARVGASGGHPLAERLPPDAWMMAASRSAAGQRVAAMRRALGAVLSVAGARVGAEAARADLDALVAEAGDEAVVGIARDGDEGSELTALLSLRDDGAGARAVLARMGRAPWLRGVRLGSALRVTTAPRGALVLRLDPTPTPAGTPATAPTAGRALAIGVRAGALAVVVGRRAQASLEAIELRPAVAPGLLDGADGESLAGGAFASGRAGDGEAVRWRYSVTREGDGLHAHAALTAPNAVLPVLRDLVGAFIP